MDRETKIMDCWILRYTGPRPRAGVPRDLLVLHRSGEGEETERETLDVEFKDAPLSRAVGLQVERGRSRLILDLVHEKHMDSNDLAQTLAAFKGAKEFSAELVIANANAKIQEIFRITHLDQVVSLFNSLEEAARHFSDASA
jgi:anti-anti-sigma regulatory factor